MKKKLIQYHRFVFKGELKTAMASVIVVFIATLFFAHNNLYVVLGYSSLYFLLYFKFRHDRKKEYFKTVRDIIFNDNLTINV